MGGSGGGTFLGRPPEKVIEQLKKANQRIEDKSFEVAIADSLDGLLSIYNDRDTVLINERLGEVLGCLEDYIEGSLDTLFGGSVAKHTYVDGLSDIDSLLIINNTELENYSPQKIISFLQKVLVDKMDKTINISKGKIALTLSYADGMQIQILPAQKIEAGLRVPSWHANTWSQIKPMSFTEALATCNNTCNKKLVPTIKLAKAINSSLPEQQQLSGYHIESLAIEAFKRYDGPKTTSKMLVHFFDTAKELVLTPIKDKTGQSRHVDDYMGESNSEQRTKTSYILNRIHKRMVNANISQSQEQWHAIFE